MCTASPVHKSEVKVSLFFTSVTLFPVAKKTELYRHLLCTHHITWCHRGQTCHLPVPGDLFKRKQLLKTVCIFRCLTVFLSIFAQAGGCPRPGLPTPRLTRRISELSTSQPHLRTSSHTTGRAATLQARNELIVNQSTVWLLELTEEVKKKNY